MNDRYLEEDLARVSSPVAGELITGVFIYLSRHTKNWTDKDWTRSSSERQAIRRQINASGLAQAMSAGHEGLPDIYAAMAWPWNVIEGMTKPQNYEQLGQHVAQNLGWYLEPRKRFPLVETICQALAICIAVFGGLFLRRHDSSVGEAVFGVSCIMLALAIGALPPLITRNRWSLGPYAVVELYDYLVTEYSDPFETPPGEPLVIKIVPSDQ